MNLQMRNDIALAREQINRVTSAIKNEHLRTAAYNIAVKAYLKGYYAALRNVQRETTNDK